MGTSAIFDLNMATEWLNFNIFVWILFYIIIVHKLHIIVELELQCYQNVCFVYKKPLFFKQNSDYLKIKYFDFGGH